jgi:hypothetical protein
MSEPAVPLPARPSLEQLRKQAKELSAADGVPLAQGQFQLARKYGFTTWADLAHHVESLQLPTLSQFERLAHELLAAFAAGDHAAGERVAGYFARVFSPQTWRVRLREEFGIIGEVLQNPKLVLDDAQRFVARAHGFERWAELVTHMSPRREKHSEGDALPYHIDWKHNRISPRHVLTRADWDQIIAIMTEEEITGLDAGGQMTADVLEKVSRLEHITHLGLGGSDRLTDDGLLQVARLRQLEHLDLGGGRSGITDRGLRVLGELPALREFMAWWSQRISDAGIAQLASCQQLEIVDIMGTPTGDGLFKALAGKQHLRIVKAGRLCTDDGLRYLHEIPVFKACQGGDPAEYALMNYDGKPNHLMLDGPITNHGLASLTGLAGLAGLSLFWHISALTPDGLAALPGIPNLSFLGCEGRLCDDRAMQHIAAIPGLRMLMGQGAVATDDGFAALSRSQTLEYFWGRDCPNLAGRGFAALADLPSLCGIGVSLKQVDDASLSALPRFPKLRQLMPMDVTDDGFRHVGQCAQLDDLVCMYCRETGDAATEHIAGLTRLRHYYAGNTRITDRSLEILGQLTTLEELEFWECAGISDDGLTHLAMLPRLRSIGVSGSPRISRKGMGVFPAGVRVDYGT